jgi:hypothetical protein
LNFCSVQTEFGITPPDTVLPRPACQLPTTALPRSPLSLPHPTADTGPLTRPTPLVSHVVPRRSCPAALPCSATMASAMPDGRRPLPATFLCLALPTEHRGPDSALDFGLPSPLSASCVGSHACWVPSPIRATLTLAFVPRSYRVYIDSNHRDSRILVTAYL